LQPLADAVAEGDRIAESASQQGLPLRLLGGVAVALRCPSSRQPPLRREYADIDLAARGSAAKDTIALLGSLGYAPDREFNTLHGHRRLLFWDEANQRQVDVFVDEANLCHRIDFRDRLELPSQTLSLADLTVLKLQVVETNDKDYLDLCAIFADHDLGSAESEVDSAYVASLAARDWGLWRTMGIVAERTAQFALALPEFEAGERVANRLRRLREELDKVPKTRGWKLRSRIGDRKRWYELPEEVH
jgi:hypothetical protein